MRLTCFVVQQTVNRITIINWKRLSYKEQGYREEELEHSRGELMHVPAHITCAPTMC